MGYLALILFAAIFLAILRGYPVAFTLGGLSVVMGIVLHFVAPDLFTLNDFKLLAPRMMGTLKNYVLLAVPMFIFMGIMLQKSGLAESLLETMASLFGGLPGGLAISVIVVGALLAASTGIVGATVVTMGLISLPTMLKRGYDKGLATGVICASGTLGQIIPPSIVLVLLADTINSSSRGSSNVDVGSMFSAAFLPGLTLVVLYVLYVLVRTLLRPSLAPPVSQEEIQALKQEGFGKKVITAFVMPLSLIVVVLGTIFAGIASPTEAAAVGALGAMILTMIQGKFSVSVLKTVAEETTHLTSMVFFILLGATTFSLVFKMLEGDVFLIEWIQGAQWSPTTFLIVVMIIIFIIGFFIDFIEIIFILIPVVVPIFEVMEINLLWAGVLIAMNLQTSFLTPPFGFSLFYLKGVSPEGVETKDIYRGVIPFIFIQMVFIVVIYMYPGLIV